MPINLTNLVTAISTFADNTQTSILDLAKLSQINDLIDNFISVKSFDNRAQLPAARSNKGKYVYLRDSAEILYSNGAIWTQQSRINQQVWSWGLNDAGQLGDNTKTNRSSPVREISSSTNWQQVNFNIFHTSAIKTDGTLWAWGPCGFGQLGNGTLTSRVSPTQEITGSTNWSQVSNGWYHSTAIKADGTLWSWGYNTTGQLGTNDLTSRLSPTQEITSSTTWSQVSAGGDHTVAIKTDGTLWGWGSNSYGKLGDGTSISKRSPVQEITSSINWLKVAGGLYNTSAIKTDGTLWMWGRNDWGQIGDGTRTSRNSPVQEITSSTNWSKISEIAVHTSAIKTDGTLWSWGYNSYGELGDGTTVSKLSPVQEITGSTEWNQVSSGYFHTAAIKNDGTLWTWGRNNFGQLGDDTTTNKSSPVKEITVSNNWLTVSTVGNATVALKVY